MFDDTMLHVIPIETRHKQERLFPLQEQAPNSVAMQTEKPASVVLSEQASEGEAVPPASLFVP
ncbi:MAG: hypothetical protein N2049_03975 [Anaerolineales bacterium]|nr:hypothetical protein [Anaerolineales bacterium]MCX7608360.1 hypothetical protein [Anaerolineales bacterium]MDW8227428.1 hypothetical protein [Anaerolineales bacterium]